MEDPKVEEGRGMLEDQQRGQVTGGSQGNSKRGQAVGPDPAGPLVPCEDDDGSHFEEVGGS